MVRASADNEQERVLRELEFRMGVTTVMLSTLDLDYILYVILSGITSGDGLGFNRAFLFLDDDAGRELRVTLAVGPIDRQEADRIWKSIEREKINFTDLLPRYETFSDDAASQVLTAKMSGFKLPMRRLEAIAASPHELIHDSETTLSAVLARCLVNRRPFSSNQLTLRQEVGGSSGDLLTFRHVAMVPLTVERRLIGAIVADNVFSERAVDADQLRALHALGNLAALAIDRARLHARTVAMAEVDGLTGVYNRRHYTKTLTQALAQRERAGTELAIVVFDLDHFKGYNDRLGHLVGDELLKGVARLLVEQVRGSDMVARYGGEEFVVLLRETPAAGAVAVAEKLRAAIKQASLADGKVNGLTLSAGVAQARPGDSVEQLFARADAALYAAKAAGRDQVMMEQGDRPEASEKEAPVPGAPKDVGD